MQRVNPACTHHEPKQLKLSENCAVSITTLVLNRGTRHAKVDDSTENDVRSTFYVIEGVKKFCTHMCTLRKIIAKELHCVNE